MEKLLLFLKKNYWYAIAVIFLLFFAGNCANDAYQRSEGTRTQLKKDVKILKDSISVLEKSRIAEKDSIAKENVKREKKIRSLEDRSLKSEKRVVALQAQNKVNKERIAKLDYIESAQEINTIYQTNDAVATDTSVDLHGDLPNRILQTVADANNCQEVVAEKDSQIADKKATIVEKDAQIADGATLLNSAEKTIKAKDDLQQKTEEQLKATEKSLRAKKTSGTVKTVMIGVAAVVGAVVGHSLSK